MSWQQTVFIYPTLFATLVAAGLGSYTLWYVRRHGASPVLVTFLVLNVGMVVWTGFSALKLLATDPATKLLFYRLLYLGVAPLAPFSLLFALAYTDREEWVTPRVAGALLVAPAVYIGLVFTNPADLAIESVRVLEANGVTVMRVGVGPAHIVLLSFYQLSLAAVAFGLVSYEAVRLGRIYAPQAILLGVGILAPMLFTILATVGVVPFDPDGVNLVPTSAAVTATALGVAIFRYRLLQLPPIAYTTAIEELPDSVLVLDTDERIVHGNEQGTALLADLGTDVGDSLDEAFPTVATDGDDTDRVTVTTTAGSETVLNARTRELTRSGRTVGWVLILRDVTELQRQKETIAEQKESLELLNQMVRHDIRNDLQVILSYTDLLEAEGKADSEYVGPISESADRAVELTNAARRMTDAVLEADEDHSAVDLQQCIEDEIAEMRSSYLETTVAVDGTLPNVSVTGGDMLSTVFRNLLRNAIQHNDSDRPEVSVAASAADGTVTVRVTDNGPGVPDEQKDEIFSEGESGIASDGSGIGLHLVGTVVGSYGGEVWVEDNHPRGAVFVVELPLAE